MVTAQTTQDPVGGLLPTWSSPSRPTPEQEPDSLPPQSPSPDANPDLSVPEPRKSSTDTRTRTSGSIGKEHLRITGEAVAALIGGTAVIVAALVRWRTSARRKLRQPTDGHLSDIGAPLGAILARHLDAAWLTPDLLDGARVAVAVGKYLNDGPLLDWDRPDPNLPENLNQPQES